MKKQKRRIHRLIIGGLLLLSLAPFLKQLSELPAALTSFREEGTEREKLTVMSYNIHNLFDDVDNGTEYDNYDPGSHRWSSDDFTRKTEAIAKVIRESVPGGPDIIALQEIENPNTLRALNRQLKDLNYRHEIMVPVDNSAINIAFLSRVPVNRVRTHNLPDWRRKRLRNILEIEVRYKNHRLYIFNNHWKSKIEEPSETEEARLAAATLIRKRIALLTMFNPNIDILVTGDLNEEEEEFINNNRRYQTALLPWEENVPRSYRKSSLFLTKDPAHCGLWEEKITLYNPWHEVPVAMKGSYVYNKKWIEVDFLLLSKGLFDNKGFYYKTGSFQPVRLEFLLTPRSRVPKTWSSRDNQGFSDHLPLIIELGIEKEPLKE